MTLRSARIVLLMPLVVLGALGSAWAQSTRATALTVSAGVADDSAATGPAVGGSLHLDVTPTFGVEGAGRWLDRGVDASAFAADLSAAFGLRISDAAMPYATVGVGLYRATFDLPALGSPMPSNVPPFYGRRMNATSIGTVTRSFTDPTFVLGTGVRLTTARGLVLRPDVRMLFVRRDGATHRVLVASMGLGIRFEHRPVTP